MFALTRTFLAFVNNRIRSIEVTRDGSESEDRGEKLHRDERCLNADADESENLRRPGLEPQSAAQSQACAHTIEIPSMKCAFVFQFTIFSARIVALMKASQFPNESSAASFDGGLTHPSQRTPPPRKSRRVTGLLSFVGIFLAFISPTLVQGGDGGFHKTFGPHFQARPGSAKFWLRHPAPRSRDALATLHFWNAVALDANALDHTELADGETGLFGEQFGPGRSSRALAMVHIAMFEAVNAIDGGCRSFLKLAPPGRPASMAAAIAQAAHDVLTALYPSQAVSFGELLAADLASLPKGRPKAEGLELGARAAAALLALRSNDGSQHLEASMGIDYIPGEPAGEWRQDPVSKMPLVLGMRWGAVTPFALRSSADFRAVPPPALGSAEYTTAYTEAKSLGGDGVVTPTTRSPEQTRIGLFWAYDGTPGLGTPQRLYNQIAIHIAIQKRSPVVETARLLALVNMAMADAGIAAWESKFHYRFWRPVTGIREANTGMGPTGLGDGNPATIADPTFMPLGAPASNLMGPNFTPPFPSYPSGHATFGAALFQTLRRFYGTDAIAFTFTSDELNGVTLDNQSVARPLSPRRFATLSQAEEENGQSRIYLGIHWAFDKRAGIAMGRKVANHVFDNVFVPLRRHGSGR